MLRVSLAVVLSCLAVSAFATPTFQYQLATNNGFESALTGWTSQDQSTQGAWSATNVTKLPLCGRGTPGPALGKAFAATDGHGWDTCVLTQKFSVSYACTVAVGFDVFANEWAAPSTACPDGIGYLDGLRPSRFKAPGWRVDILKQTAGPFSIAASDIVAKIAAAGGTKTVFGRSGGWTHRCLLISLQPGDYTLRLGVLADVDVFNAGFDNVSLSAGHPHHEIAFDSNRNSPAASPTLLDVFLYNQTMNFVDPTPGLNSPTATDSSPTLSADGHCIVFSSDRASRYKPTLCLWDRVTRALGSLPGLAVSGSSDVSPSVSADGRFIVFTSDRPCAAGGAGSRHVFLYDRNSAGIVGLPGLNTAADEAYPSISADGRLIAFSSPRAGAVGKYDIYLYDREAKSLVSLPGLNFTGQDFHPALSADGRYIVFDSDRVGGLGNWDVYLYDVTAKALVAVPNLNSSGDEKTPSISWDNRYIAFGYNPRIEGRFDDIHIYDRTTTVVSTAGTMNSPKYDGGPVMR